MSATPEAVPSFVVLPTHLYDRLCPLICRLVTQTFDDPPGAQVCQIGVRTEFDIVILSQDGDFDFKTITVSLFLKFDWEPFFLVCQKTDFFLKKYHSTVKNF